MARVIISLRRDIFKNWYSKRKGTEQKESSERTTRVIKTQNENDLMSH